MASIADFLTNEADKIKTGIKPTDFIRAQYSYSGVHTVGSFTDLEFTTAPKTYKKLFTSGTTYGVDSNGFEFFGSIAHPELYALDVNGFRFKFSIDASTESAIIVGTDVKHKFEYNSTDQNGIVIPADVALISKEPITDNAITAIADNATNIGTKYVLKADNKYYTVQSGAAVEISDIMNDGFDSTETGFNVSSLGTDVYLIIVCSVDDSSPSTFDFTLTYGLTEATVTGGTRSGNTIEFVNFHLLNDDVLDTYVMLADHAVQDGIYNSDLYADTDLYGFNSRYGKNLTNYEKKSNLYVKVPSYDDFDAYVPNIVTYTNQYSAISDPDNSDYATDEKITGNQDSLRMVQATGTPASGTTFRPMITIMYESALGKSYANAGRMEDFFWNNSDVMTTVSRSEVTITENTKHVLPMVKLGGVDDTTVPFADRKPTTLTNLFGFNTGVKEFYFKFWINTENAASMATAYTEFVFCDPDNASKTITMRIADDSVTITGASPVFSKSATLLNFKAGEFILHIRTKDSSNTALVELTKDGQAVITATEAADSINFTNRFIVSSIAYHNGASESSFSLLSEMIFFETPLDKNNHMIPLGMNNVVTDPGVAWSSTTVGDKEIYTTNAVGSQYLYHDLDTTNLDTAAAAAMQLDIVGMTVSTAGMVDTTDHTQIGAYSTNVRDTLHTVTREYTTKNIGSDKGNLTFRDDPVTRANITKATLQAIEVGTVTAPPQT